MNHFLKYHMVPTSKSSGINKKNLFGFKIFHLKRFFGFIGTQNPEPFPGTFLPENFA